MRRLEWMALAVSLVAAAVGCGYPQFSFTGAGGSGGAEGGSTHGHTGGGAAPPTCQVLDSAASCGASGKCTVVDTTTGAVGCVTLEPPTLNRFDACTTDTSCPAGTWCNILTAVCSPFCAGSASCGDGTCIPAVDESDTPIPGISVCTAHCDPVAATPCGQGATCIYDPDDDQFDCASSAFAPEDMQCEQSSDCARGLVCAGNASGGTCFYWCEPASTYASDCFGTYCNPLVGADMNPIMYDGAVYGYCD